jgi:polyisoprenoid-binding protein YceI
MKKHWKKLISALVGLAIVVLGGSFVYAKIINKAPEKLDEGDLAGALVDDAAPPAAGEAVLDPYGAPVAAADPGAEAPAPVATPSGVDGAWNVTTDSTLRYRVKESINGFDTEAVGETNQITGALTIEGTTVTGADFTVDMTTFSSDEGARDGQFNGRIMAVDQFPTGRFVLTSPIELGAIPADGETITATATGELTLRGVTRLVSFELTAALQNGRIGVLGNIGVVFADHDIPNPSFGTISTDDEGLLEFVLVFEHA